MTERVSSRDDGREGLHQWPFEGFPRWFAPSRPNHTRPVDTVAFRVLVTWIGTALLTSGIGAAHATDESTPLDRLATVPAERANAVADAARDAARYAADVSREASQLAEVAARVVNSAVSEAGDLLRRETSRARAAAERTWQGVEESEDERALTSAVPVIPVRPSRPAPRFRRAVQAEASFARGDALLEARKYYEARDQFEKAIALDPEHDRARAALAWSQYFLGNYRGAIVTFKAALRRQPTWEGLYDGLGWSRLRVGRYQLAIDAFRSALQRNPDYVDAWNGLGSTLFERGDYEAALAPLEKALYGHRRLEGPEPAEVTTLRAKMAWSLYYLERYREALAMFIRASLAAPGSHHLHVGMGWCYLSLGQKADARAAFQRAIRTEPNDQIVREGLRRASL